MKRVIVVAVIMAAVIGFVITVTVRQKCITDALAAQLDEIENCFMAGKSEECRALCADFAENARKSTAFLPAILPHGDVEEFTDSAALLPLLLQNGDSGFAAELERCRLRLDHLSSSGSPHFTNVL